MMVYSLSYQAHPFFFNIFVSGHDKG